MKIFIIKINDGAFLSDYRFEVLEDKVFINNCTLTKNVDNAFKFIDKYYAKKICEFLYDNFSLICNILEV